MKYVLWVMSAAVLFLVGCRQGDFSTPVFSKLHTVSIHVKDHDTHDLTYRFLRDDLQLPVVYEPVTQGIRKYAGLWAGNIVLEPCGPYPNIEYATPDFEAMFFGITFQTYESSISSASELDRRGIAHGKPYAFVIINDPSLCRENIVVSTMEIKDRAKEKAKHDSLSSILKTKNGGPLGIQYVEEIRIGYTDEQNLAKWRLLLSPAKQLDTKLWDVGNNLTIRFAKSDVKEITAIVMKVASLERAVDHLKTKDMLEKVSPNKAEISTPENWSVRIILRE